MNTGWDLLCWQLKGEADSKAQSQVNQCERMWAVHLRPAHPFPLMSDRQPLVSLISQSAFPNLPMSARRVPRTSSWVWEEAAPSGCLSASPACSAPCEATSWWEKDSPVTASTCLRTWGRRKLSAHHRFPYNHLANNTYSLFKLF